MKAQYINPFLNATMGLFKDFLSLEVKSGKPAILENPKDLSEVSALIGLAGETTGAVVLSFSHDTALKVVSLMTGTKYAFLGSEVLDGVGELVNIIAGNAKKDLNDFRISISLPGVITGNNYRINWPKGVPIITIPFQSSIGDFTVNVSLKEAV
ncbi:MAG: chemotaxis protein CheX [Spirochaetes bacterium]|nr:MAG: chemotaxis protein CheX [Spirochaetota bacterium]RKX87350.1 MAG: chemotaxis protein CheX [Spirochaetota bacterium]RKX93592.1 MAG: chemotaxis protein CheX [Spirochaetota bacterium]